MSFWVFEVWLSVIEDVNFYLINLSLNNYIWLMIIISDSVNIDWEKG